MAASSLALFLSLAVVGMGEGVARIQPLNGVVVGPDGRPVPGAEVIAASGRPTDQANPVLGRARSDDSGRFQFELAREPSPCEMPMLWAVANDLIAASRPIDHRALEGDSIRLALGSPGQSAFVVVGPDRRPIADARLIPRTLARESGTIPDAIANLTAATTDHTGRADLDAFRPEELLSVAVEAPGFGIQFRDFRTPSGLANVDPKMITLQETGRVTGRVGAEDPKAAAGLKVRVESSGSRGGSNGGFAEVATDAAGHFEVPAISSGALTIRVLPREGSADLPARIVRRNLEAGREVNVEIPLRRGVRVSGVALGASDGQPIAGVVISVVPSGQVEPSRVRTDASGRYETFVPAGLVSHRVLEVPSPYLCPPNFVGPRPMEVPPAIARFELPIIRLARGADLSGKVLDADRKPVAGARVEASWMVVDGRTRAPRSETTSSKADGSFVLGPVPLDYELTLKASKDEAETIEPVRARASDPQPVELRIVEPDGDPATGRVVASNGRPIAGASVRIWALSLTPGGAIESTRLVRFDDSDELLTDETGRFETDRPLRGNGLYRVVASAEGFLPGQSRTIRLSGSFPDLVLVGEARRVTVAGRVVDRSGHSVEGVEIRTSAEGPGSLRGVTDADGRFQLQDVPEGPLFLFAAKSGFRFFGRSIEAGGPSLELRLTGHDEPSTSSMTTRKIPSAGIGLARRVLAPYAEKVLTEGDQTTRTRTLVLLAGVDPRRVLKLIEDRVVADPWLDDYLRHAASCSPVTEPLVERSNLVESIHEPEWRVAGFLDAADALPEASRTLKRERVEQALGVARSIREPARRVIALTKVADRLIKLGQLDRAGRLLDEIRPIAEGLSPATSGGQARVEFAEVLARVDPASALALTDGLLDPGAFDRSRVKIAQIIAARAPTEAARILESLRDTRAIAPALPALCHALAPIDPAQARRLLARARNDEPCLVPYSLGLMALAIADRDKPTARAWLEEAFDQLGQIAKDPTSPRDPSAVAAALLPVAERIEASLVPEFFWRAVALHAPRSGTEISSRAVLALLLARYDGEVARGFVDPLADRALSSNESELSTLMATLAILDPLRAVRLIEELPEPADFRFHHPRNEARLSLAAALLKGTPACWEDATVQFLHLPTEASPDAN